MSDVSFAISQRFTDLGRDAIESYRAVKTSRGLDPFPHLLKASEGTSFASSFATNLKRFFLNLPDAFRSQAIYATRKLVNEDLFNPLLNLDPKLEESLASKINEAFSSPDPALAIKQLKTFMDEDFEAYAFINCGSSGQGYIYDQGLLKLRTGTLQRVLLELLQSKNLFEDTKNKHHQEMVDILLKGFANAKDKFVFLGKDTSDSFNALTQIYKASQNPQTPKSLITKLLCMFKIQDLQKAIEVLEQQTKPQSKTGESVPADTKIPGEAFTYVNLKSWQEATFTINHDQLVFRDEVA
jgi:hypothetical protein